MPDTIHAYDSRASIRFESPDFKESLSLHLRQLRNDTLAVGASATLGLTVARALVTRDSFFVFDRLKRTLYYNSTKEALEHLRMPVSLADVASNLLGTIYPPGGRDWSVTADSAYYFVSNAVSHERYTIDPRIWRVTRYERWDETGMPVEIREFSDFDLFGSAYLPRRVVLRVPPDEQYLSLYHRSLEINPDRLDLSFRTSDSPERVIFP